MKVKRNADSNKFCGPAALSLLTGRHVDSCIKEIRAFRNRDGFLSGFRRRPVKGMDKTEVVRVLNRMGYMPQTVFHWELDHVPLKSLDEQDSGKPTLVAFMRWLKKHPCWSPKKKYLVMVTDHYVVVRGRKLFDNHNPEGVFFGRYDRRRKRVIQAWEVARLAT
jgi:hypothetical protein